MSGKRRGAALAAATMLAVAALLVGCASAPPTPAPAASAAQVPSVAAAPGAPSQAGTAVPIPELSPAQARAQAQRLAVEAVDQLQNGDEALARTTLDKALELDTGNELARKLVDQIQADAEKELGPVFFRYTVQRDDSLSKLAQQFLGDRYRFYILAKYNGIPNPSRLAAGQVVRIPGKAATAAAATVGTGTRAQGEPEARTVEAAALSSPSSREAAGLVARGAELRRLGDLEGAYAALSEAVRKDPGNRDAMLQRNNTRQELLRTYEREAAQAFQRQNLDLAIAKWDRIVELDPANRKARLERERALDLQRKMNEKFGAR